MLYVYNVNVSNLKFNYWFSVRLLHRKQVLPAECFLMSPAVAALSNLSFGRHRQPASCSLRNTAEMLFVLQIISEPHECI